MRCHFTTTDDGKKVLIPNCWDVVNTNDITNCSCKVETFNSFEKQRYNEVLTSQRNKIIELEQEVIRLNRQLRKQYKKNQKHIPNENN
jgi:hypothetical protein